MDSIRIDTYSNDDVPQIIELLNTVFSKQQYFNLQRDFNWWNWKYNNNIFGQPIIVVAKANNNRIVGSRAFWPWELIYNGNRLKAFQPVDTVVHPDYRNMGLFRKMTNKALDETAQQNVDIIFNFPNEQSLSGYLKLGWHLLGKLEWGVKILNPIKIIGSLKKRDQFYPVELPEEFRMTSEKCVGCTSHEYGENILQTNKSEDFVQWRYADHPYFQYGIVTESIGNSKMSLIFMINENIFRKEMIITDIVGDKSCLKCAFRKLFDLARSLDVHLVTIVQSIFYEMKKVLWKMGFIPIMNKNLVSLAGNTEVSNSVLEMGKWDLVGGMHDAI